MENVHHALIIINFIKILAHVSAAHKVIIFLYNLDKIVRFALLKLQYLLANAQYVLIIISLKAQETVSNVSHLVNFVHL